jgi:hypothetical protein
VIEGNERVVRPRLADAKFFFDQDRRKTLSSRVAGLDRVVYHGKLGSQGERVRRVQAIAGALAAAAGGDAELAGQADRAALLAKADLLTDMVGEFPELQGTMGRYYALNDGEDGEVASRDRGPLPAALRRRRAAAQSGGALVAVADKLETLVGLFAIDQLPTGDKDPFALRRHALGVLRILTERLPALSLDAAIDAAIAAPPGRPRRASRRPRSPGSAGSDPRRAARLLRRPPRRLARRSRLRRRRDRRGARRRQVLAARRGRAAPGRAAPVRRPARGGLAGGGEQARRQHPEEGERADRRHGRAGAPARACRGRARRRAAQRRRRSPRPPCAGRDYAGRCAPWPRCARRSTPSSIRSWSMPTMRPCAPTAWPCSAGCTRR